MAKSAWSGSVDRNIRRVVVNGRKLFMVQVGGRGRGNRKSKLCDTIEQALAVRAKLLAGEVPTTDPPKGEAPPDVEDALRHHAHALEALGQDGCRTRQLVPAIRRIFPALLTVPIEAMTEQHVRMLVERRREAGTKDGTIIRDLRALRAAVKVIRPEFKIASAVFPSEPLERVRMLPERDQATVFSAVADMQRPLFARMAELAMVGIMRLNDVRTLKRSSVRFVERTLELPRTKGNPPRPRLVRLSERAVEILREQMGEWPGEYVFANPATGQPYCRGWVSEVWRDAARAQNLHGFTFHDLRHHTPTVAANAGATWPIIKAMGGWKSDKPAQRYVAILGPTIDHYLALGSRPSASLPR